jgi:catechol 2,3-dioxygenase-like lactoylglutathione lyase family enzyme
MVGPMFDHVELRTSDRAASERFYDTVLRPLGIERTYTGDDVVEWDDFGLAQATDSQPPTRGLHLAFVSPSRAEVDAFWQAGTEAGYRDDGAPGPRPQYRHDYYGSFLLDPDGNSAEAVHHGAMRSGGNVDHLWIRVADVTASKRFYETVGPHAGFALHSEREGFAHFGGGDGSFSVLDGDHVTEHLHMAFPAGENGTVDAFHRVAVGAGYRDNGGPGERPAYHEGYYAAFVLDPDGNNVEVVNHNR